METVIYNTVVIGSGCAGLNAADWLSELGRESVALVTEGFYKGTSRNTGSDKQTYYKLSLCGNEKDSPLEMAETLVSGGSVDGPIALAEAAGSVFCFMRLNFLGVDFPTDEYGQFVGYKTDHDPRRRATSAGPLTSHYMTECLEKSVRNRNIDIIDSCIVIKLLTENGHVRGVIGLKDETYISIICKNLIWCTGGPCGIYQDTVYPESQRGMSGILLDAGADGANLEHWQFGIASVKFRWNLSGTYQQVLPRYISIDEYGTEYEFLPEYAKDYLAYEFLKGYQWPFDSRKINNGSSIIDFAVYQETILKKRQVYLDYRNNPTQLDHNFSNIGEEGYTYLKNSDALFGTPIDRLKKMNPFAVRLYKDHGIDLENELLEIRVCAQSHNGGILVDENWESNIKGLYVAGEAAGTFGPYRPGGTSLNSSQVGSMRAAQHIVRTTCDTTYEEPEISDIMKQVAEFETRMYRNKKNTLMTSCIDLGKEFRIRMSADAAFVRDMEKLKIMRYDLCTILPTYFEKFCVPQGSSISHLYTVYDQLVTSLAVVISILEGGRVNGSLGGAIMSNDGKHIKSIETNRNSRTITQKTGLGFFSHQEIVRPIPKVDPWFETVWIEHLQKRSRRIEIKNKL